MIICVKNLNECDCRDYRRLKSWHGQIYPFMPPRWQTRMFHILGAAPRSFAVTEAEEDYF
jgi:hypothetical protein